MSIIEIKDKLQENNYNINTIKFIINQLGKIKYNGKLSYFKDIDNVKNILDRMKINKNTKKTYTYNLYLIVKLMIDDKDLIDDYKNLYNETKQQYDGQEKTNNLLISTKTYDNINNIKNKNIEKFNKTGKHRYIYNAFIISLYVDIPPRRNMDYLLCRIVNKKKDIEKISNKYDYNYLVKNDDEFIFYKYKTAQRLGGDIKESKINFKTNEEFKKILNMYLKSLSKQNNDNDYLLGKKHSSINYLTLKLNSLLGQNIGSSLLRKLYLSNKYKDSLELLDNLKKDSLEMGHSLGTQQQVYIKEI